MNNNIYNYKSTIVTMYFNLTELKDATESTRPADFYLNHGRNLLQLDNPMIIFCDSKTIPLIKAIRDEYITTPSLTVYIEKNISEYDFYKNNWEIIRKNRSAFSYYNIPHYKRVTVSQSLTYMFKIFAIQIAHERNDFNTTHYVWMDFGCNHVAPTNIKEASLNLLNNPNPKISMMSIKYINKSELDNMTLFCNSGTCCVAGTVFSVQREYVSMLYTSMLSIFYEQLFKRVIHTDEQVLVYAYDRNPELFTLYYGDYYSVIINYHNVVADWHSIRWNFIQNALLHSRIDLAKDAANKIYQSYTNKFITLPDEDIKYVEDILNKT